MERGSDFFLTFSTPLDREGDSVEGTFSGEVSQKLKNDSHAPWGAEKSLLPMERGDEIFDFFDPSRARR